MKVLSLFDGISCGRIALERAGIPVDVYFASEIDKTAITITKYHYPDTIELGNVCDISYKDGILTAGDMQYETDIDILIGGSPCTNLSFIGTKAGFTTGDEEILTLDRYLELKEAGEQFSGQSYLFWEYLRILKEVKPKYFLLENVKMAEKWEDIITRELGVKPIKINSSLLSAQNRPRLYWTNIPGVDIPKDKGIVIDDILDKDPDVSDVSYTETVQKALPIIHDHYGYLPERFNAYNVSRIKDKARALTAGGSPITSTCATLMFVKVPEGVHEVKDGIMDGKYRVRFEDGRYNIRKLSESEMERLQTLPEGYTAVQGVSDNRRRHAIGNGWTVDVIAYIMSFIPSCD